MEPCSTSARVRGVQKESRKNPNFLKSQFPVLAEVGGSSPHLLEGEQMDFCRVTWMKSFESLPALWLGDGLLEVTPMVN